MTTQAAAALTGLGASTIKRWADEGRIAHFKTPGGHRRLSKTSLLALVAAESAAPEWIDVLLNRSDYEVLARLLDLRGRLESWAAAADALSPLLHALGTQWIDGRLTIVQEHLISERLLRTLRRALDLMPVAPRAPTAMLACAPGDEHTLALALCELVFREAGYQTLWSGRATPTEELCRVARQSEVKALAISASAASKQAKRLREQYDQLSAACTAGGVKLFLGGQGAWPKGSALASFTALKNAL